MSKGSICWEKLAHEVEDTYGGFVDWDEEFFECPECGEPIYKCDWTDADFAMGRTYNPKVGLKLYCPVCESKILSEGE